MRSFNVGLVAVLVLLPVCPSLAQGPRTINEGIEASCDGNRGESGSFCWLGDGPPSGSSSLECCLGPGCRPEDQFPLQYYPLFGMPEEIQRACYPGLGPPTIIDPNEVTSAGHRNERAPCDRQVCQRSVVD